MGWKLGASVFPSKFHCFILPDPFAVPALSVGISKKHVGLMACLTLPFSFPSHLRLLVLARMVTLQALAKEFLNRFVLGL